MIGIVLPLLAALVYSLSAVLVRKKLDASNSFSVSLTITFIANVFLWPLVFLFTNLRTVNLEGVLFFALAGTLAPGIARLLYYEGMGIVGVSVSESVFSIYPLYTSMLAILLLSEVLSLENWIGIICIVGGGFFIERSLSKPKSRSEGVSRKGLTFPLLAALMAAFAVICKKHGLNIYNEPLLSVAIAQASSLFLYFLVLISSHTTRNSFSLGKEIRFFWKAAVCLPLGWISTSYALIHEDASIVTALTATQPLFVLLFSYLYLKELEHLSSKLVLSTILIVIGTMFVSIR